MICRKKANINGIEVEWECNTITDAKNFTKTIKELIKSGGKK